MTKNNNIFYKYDEDIREYGGYLYTIGQKLSSKIAYQIRRHRIDDFNNPSYYNIQWMKLRYQQGKYL